ncbi:MAG TPA: aconitate hydratase [Desulfobacteraceae bacterium]|nr:aconitate hydratase [Desulfobacteraceae bacterium]HPQ29924.1 aconitate hydratase [Desulfobacteraceae bacterium]
MSYSDNLIGQILSRHIEEGELLPGKEIGIRIDQTLTQDATGTLVFLEFMALGAGNVKTRLSVSYVDHNTLQSGPENADDHRFLQSAAARYGVYFSKPGNGICHQVHLERFAVPGQTLLGSDSHTPTSGGLGMLAIGAGGMDVALAMSGAPFYMTVPRVLHVNLEGALSPWVGAKDVILYLLKLLTVKGGLGWAVEYGGPGVKTLGVPERATITNMGAELGAWTSIFPSDEITRDFLNKQKRQDIWSFLSARDGAEYGRELEVDLSSLVPLTARPSSPDSVVPVTDVAGLKVDQVIIGSCTNSSYRDLRLVAELLKGKKVHPDTSLAIAPGSRQVMTMLAREGALADMVESGARILEAACGPCIGMGQAPPSGGVSLRTFNRNFPGRSGTPDGQVFLVGPESAAAAALTGRFTDPRELGSLPVFHEPEHYYVSDNLIISPPPHNEEAVIRMGPNIKPLPLKKPLSDAFSLEILLKVTDNISTDDILPGGAKVLPLRSNLPALAEFVFSGHDPAFVSRAKTAGNGAIVGRDNYGQGSSREHAALAPGYLGVQAVLALSVARLHRANLINFGVIPILISAEDYEKLDQGDIIECRNIKEHIANRDSISIMIPEKGLEIEGILELSSREREILLAGGILNFMKEKLKEQ